MKIRSEKHLHPNGKICENEFEYHTKSEIYKNKGSDMGELAEILCASKEINFKGFSRQIENFLNMCMYLAVNKRYEHDEQKNNSIS